MILVDIQKKHVAQSDTQLDAAEDAAIKKYEEHLKEESEKTSSGDMDDYDRYQLQKLFISYAGIEFFLHKRQRIMNKRQ